MPQTPSILSPAPDETPVVYEFPASPAQGRLLMLERLRPGTAQYNVPAAFSVSGPFDIAAFRAALDVVVARHEALRTTFRTEDGNELQVVSAAAKADIRVRDAESASAAESALLDEARRPFDLERGPLLRCVAYRLPDGDHRVLLSLHHAICDGWSLRIILRELAAAYSAACTGVAADLPEPAAQYPDYAAWQRRRRDAGDLRKAVDHWARSLEGAPISPALPTDRPRPAVLTAAGRVQRFTLPPTLHARVTRCARSAGLTEYTVMFAAFNVLLSRLSGRTDLVVGTPVAGRDHPDLQDVVGLLTNTVAVRTDLSGEPTFHELLARVRDRLRDAHRHQEAPLESVIEAVAPPRDPSHDPVVQVTFAYDDTAYELELLGARTERLRVDLDVAKFDLVMYVERCAADDVVLLEYRSDLLDDETVGHWGRGFLVLLDHLVDRPDRPVGAADLLDEEQLRLLRHEWSGIRTPPPSRLTPDLIAEQAATRPGATALVCRGARLSYAELLDRADRLAAGLRAAGVGPDVPVAVCLGRTAEMGVAALAVLRAGGVYLALETSLPPARMRRMLREAGCRLVLAAAHTADLVAELDADTDMDVQVAFVADGATGFVEPPRPVRNPPRRAVPSPADGAYLIFTSGSTGVPKGVLVEHRALTNLTTAVRESFGLTGRDRVLQHVSLAFDVSISDLFGTWVAGAELHIAAEDERIGEALHDRFAESAITFGFLSPTALMSMPCPPDALPGLTTLIVGGEACPAELVRRWTTARRRVVNGYGPSETAVYATNADLTPGEPVVIGRPVPNFRAYVLDRRLRPTPIGATGELYLAGDGVARGYTGRAGMTAERFVADPFGPAGTRMYRTGDLARLDVGGRLHYLGRTDGQVKLRGFRVELGEIETVLAGHAAVAAAAALVRGPAEDRRLLGYAVAADPADPPSPAALRGWLAERLPAYLVPEVITLIDALPTSRSGKLDRDRLPDPPSARPDTERPYAGPATPTERRVALVWERVLGIDRIGREDNFFDLGGTSTRLLAVFTSLRRFGPAAADLTLVDLFRFPDVASLAARLDRAAASADAPTDDREEAAEARRRGEDRRRRAAGAQRRRISMKGTEG